MKTSPAQISMIVCTMIIALLVGIVGLQFIKTDSKVIETHAPDGFGGPFTLTDTQGKSFSSTTIGNKYRLIYFGFTTCPAICPTELAKMTEALTSLGAEITKQVQPIFITIDPARDTQDVIKDYLTNFHSSFIGLTGSQAEIDKVVSTYKVYAAKVQDPNASTYTMDHSSYIFLMNEDDRLVKIFKMTDSADVVAAFIKDHLK